MVCVVVGTTFAPIVGNRMEKAHKAPTKSRLVSRKKCKFIFIFSLLLLSCFAPLAVHSQKFSFLFVVLLVLLLRRCFASLSTDLCFNMIQLYFFRGWWNEIGISFLFQRQRLMQVNAFVYMCVGAGWSRSLGCWWINGLKLLVRLDINSFAHFATLFLGNAGLPSRITSKCEVNKNAFYRLESAAVNWITSSCNNMG